MLIVIGSLIIHYNIRDQYINKCIEHVFLENPQFWKLTMVE